VPAGFDGYPREKGQAGELCGLTACHAKLQAAVLNKVGKELVCEDAKICEK
jgi:hypothetical protein